MKPIFEPGDVITADKLNSLALNLLQLIHAGPGISIRRLGDTITISVLRAGGGGGGGRDSHHVVAAFSEFASLANDAVGDFGVSTTEGCAAFADSSSGNPSWERLAPLHVTTASSPTTPELTDGHWWNEQYNDRLFFCMSAVYFPVLHIGPTIIS